MSNESAGLTPKGEPMPQTVEEWEYLANQYEKAMLEMKNEITSLKQRINKLEQRPAQRVYPAGCSDGNTYIVS